MAATDGQPYPFGYGDEELTRLGAQHRVWQKENQRLLSRAGFGRGDTVVDLGCGPGLTTLDLARRVGPLGRILAVDRDGEKSIPRLREAADAAGFGNVEARVADLEQFDLPSESVDGVYGRWVLMYLPEREARALATRIAKWLRPGGACVLAEFCNYRHICVYPPMEHFGLVAEALMRAAAGERGGNPEIGGVLPGVLDGAGLEVELAVVTKAIRSATQDWDWPDTLFRDFLPMLVDKGHLAGRIQDDFMAEWEERSRDPSAVFFSSPVLEVIGRRA
ncbi:MAG: methyltransferase domain-containing protein [Gemmatimonadota bacterium]